MENRGHLSIHQSSLYFLHPFYPILISLKFIYWGIKILIFSHLLHFFILYISSFLIQKILFSFFAFLQSSPVFSLLDSSKSVSIFLIFHNFSFNFPIIISAYQPIPYMDSYLSFPDYSAINPYAFYILIPPEYVDPLQPAFNFYYPEPQGHEINPSQYCPSSQDLQNHTELKIENQQEQESEEFQKEIEKQERGCAKKGERKKQKRGRNIFSNIFRSYLKYLNSKKFLEQDMKNMGAKLTKNQFMGKLSSESRRFQNYVKREQIFEFLKDKTQKTGDCEYKRLIRSSLLSYLNDGHISTIYNSRKIQANFRKLHIRELENFLKLVIQVFEEGVKRESVKEED